MVNNTLQKIKLSIKADATDEQIKHAIDTGITRLVYSYLVRAMFNESTILEYIIEYNIADIEKYNTLKFDDYSKDIFTIITTNRTTNKHILGYKQPSLDIMLEIYSPLIKNFAKQQSAKWSMIEYDDALSMCQLTLVKLYNAGYYIHKHLLRVSYEKDILMSIRKYRNIPPVVSLDSLLYQDDDCGVNFGDTIEDTQEEIRKEELEIQDELHTVFIKIKNIIIEKWSERQFEQLFRDYGFGHTSQFSRRKMQQLKELLHKRNITLQSLLED